MTHERIGIWRHFVAAFAGGTLLLAVSGAAQAGHILITVSEASYPDSPEVQIVTRSPSFGPEIELVTPAPDGSSPSPLALKVNFTSRGAAIDPKSVKLYCLESPLVDLAERVTPYRSAKGIAMLDADVPPGTHVLRLHVKDTQGRQSVKMFKFTVAK